MNRFFAKLRSREGQGLVEYALILVLVAVALVVALNALAGGIWNAISHASSQVTAAGS